MYPNLYIITLKPGYNPADLVNTGDLLFHRGTPALAKRTNLIPNH